MIYLLSLNVKVEHEGWWFSYKSYQHQLVAIYTAWEKDRRDLLLKVQVTFADAWTEFENEKKREENRRQQVEICEKLHDKVKLQFHLLK